MRTQSYIFLLLTICIFCFSSAFAQQVTIKGQIIEAKSKLPIEFATILVIDSTNQQKLTGATSNEKGVFSINSPSEQIWIQVEFLGFEKRLIKKYLVQNQRINLGTISLVEQAATMDEVVIETEKSTTEFKLDKRVFNVGQDLSSTGASALEVLNNVPSVNVNIEGQISLRGSSGVQVLINGKPSVLASEEGNALGSITADMIDRVEVITNPSAKYEAEGTSGIINIVLKKDERKGLNGSVTVNTGTPHNHSVGLSLNRRTEKFNLFSQLGAGYRELPNVMRNINEDLVTGTSIVSEGMEFRNENFYNVILGADYHINKFNVITLSGNFAYEVEQQPSSTQFSQVNDANDTTARWQREEETSALNPKYQYELNYKRDFRDHEDHDLVFSALGRFFGKDQSSNFINIGEFGTVPARNQQVRTAFDEANYTFKLDYTKPFSDVFTLETGAQYVIQDVGNDFALDELVDGIWENDPAQTNNFEYNQKVLGAYGTGAYEGDKWGIKLGLRLENTDLNTLLVTTNQANSLNYTNLFPSAHTSYKFSQTVSLQAGYSRRIYRPRLWDLNPFFNPRNNFAIRAGNPELLPEFTDSYELTSIFYFNKISMNAGIFHRFTTDVIERVAIFDEGVSITMPMNIGTNRATGLEVNAKYSPAKWLTINGDFNFLYFTRIGEFNGASFDFTANQWNTKIQSKFKLPSKIDLEVTGRYISREQTVQGITSANIFADLGLRKKMLNGKAIINLSVRDIFASRIRERNTFQSDFFQYNFRQRGRFIVLGFSYGFGKGEAMEFSGGRRR